MIEIVRAGALTTVQDLGRPGWAHLGVPRSGALDAPALQQANRLVGNPDPYAGLETTLTGCSLRLRQAGTVAVTGAPARVRIAGQVVDLGTAVAVPAGALVEIGPARFGVRTYLAVAGGIAVEPVLGSRSTDTLSGLGPAPLRDGDLLPVGPAVGPVGPPVASPLTSAPAPAPAQPPPATLELTVRLGPRDDWFTPDAPTRCSAPCTRSA